MYKKAANVIENTPQVSKHSKKEIELKIHVEKKIHFPFVVSVKMIINKTAG